MDLSAGQGAISGESQRPRYASFSCCTCWLVSEYYGPWADRPHDTVSIHVLDDDSLLHVFYLYRPFFGDEDKVEDWNFSARWWYTLAHVCQRWRNIILGSASHLGLSLLCTYGTPVAHMLTQSPHLPLVVGYFWEDHELTTEDEEGMILALKQRDRVRRVRLHNVVTIVQRLSMVMDEEYPILEYLYISRRIEDKSTISRFPGSFQAPHLRYLSLGGFSLPIGSRLLTTAVGLVTLHLVMVHPSTYFHPNTLLRWISLMPQLEMLNIYFTFSIPNREVERQLTHTPIIAPIMLPNLYRFWFQGVSAYLEALVHRITTPRLELLNINFFNQLTFFAPRLVQFIAAAENLRSGEVVLSFLDKFATVGVYPNGDFEAYSLGIVVNCCHLDWQIFSMLQISNSLSQMFSAVESLILHHGVHSLSSEEHDEVERTEWRKLLRPFSNVKTLQIQSGLIKDLSRCLQLEDGELPLELLPELHKLECYGGADTGEAFTSFIDARRNVGLPVTLVRL